MNLLAYVNASLLVAWATLSVHAGTSYGTGWFVTHEHIVTCRHVVNGAKKVEVFLASAGRMVPVTVVAKDTKHDIALLKLAAPDPSVTPLVIRSKPSNIGEKVFTVGYPLVDMMGGEAKFTEGSVSARSGIQGTAWQLQISVPIQAGNSGGALLDEAGNVLGVISSSLNDVALLASSGAIPQSVNYAIKAKHVWYLLRHLDVKVLVQADSGKPDRTAAIEAAQGASVYVQASGTAERVTRNNAPRNEPQARQDDVESVYIFRFSGRGHGSGGWIKGLYLNGVEQKCTGFSESKAYACIINNLKEGDVIGFPIASVGSRHPSSGYICVDGDGYFLFGSDAKCRKAMISPTWEFLMARRVSTTEDVREVKEHRLSNDEVQAAFSSRTSGLYLNERDRAVLQGRLSAIGLAGQGARYGSNPAVAIRKIGIGDLKPKKHIKLTLPFAF